MSAAIIEQRTMETRIDKINKVVDALEELNFPIRGHVVKKHTEDFPFEVSVSDMNVPAIADCRFVAQQFNVLFYVDPSFNMGIFEIV